MGFIIFPSMLQTGDYIIDDETAIERKDCKTGDLQTSFYQKRLQKQLKVQKENYQRSFLLVENYETA